MLSLALVSVLIAAVPSSEPPPPAVRLGNVVRPVRYDARLTVVPEKDSFDGAITIEAELREPSPVVWLNAEALEIRKASATIGARSHTARLLPGPRGVLGLAFDGPLPEGALRLELEYSGVLSTRDIDGASRQKEGEDWYVFTHFEPLAARRVFPCFDEPSFKTPWRLTLTVPEADRAFFNTPVVKDEVIGDGLRRVEFAATKPLPSYLIAFAVGPFDVVDAGRSRGGVPLRLVTPRGLGEQAAWAAAHSAAILDWQAEYFGHPYGYEKLDGIAVPLTGGGMEHPGLITYGLRRLLRRPGEETLAWKRGLSSLIAHEDGHLWFGDLVTLAWWDDLWLNEAFATWIASKTLEGWQPTWGADEARAAARETAMSADSLVAARAIRQRIDRPDDIENAFDSITYTKGALVIHMFERWIGPEVFRQGVQAYLKKHAHGNATASDFLAAISQAAGRDIAPMFATFLDQPGLPQVSMAMQCSGSNPPRVRLSQARYVPVGSTAAGRPLEQPWQLPVCVRWGSGAASGRACTLLAEKEGSLTLDGAADCPEWLEPNEGAAGYYRPDLEAEWLERRVAYRRKLTDVERIALVGDLGAAADAAQLPYGKVLALLAPLAQDTNRRVVLATVRVASGLRSRALLPADGTEVYARFVRDVYGARARDLGWSPRPDDDEETRLLRVAVVPFVADEGQDPALAAEARRLADAWLADRRSVDAEIVDTVLGVAAVQGDIALFEKWHAAARRADRTDSLRLLAAMGMIPDPAVLKRAMAITLQDDFDPRLSMTVLSAARSVPTSRASVYDFVKSNFDALEARLPADSTARFPGYASVLCDEGVIADAERFFKERSARARGGPRALAQSLESLRLCVALRKAQASSVADFLERYPGKGAAIFRVNPSDERRQSR